KVRVHVVAAEPGEGIGHRAKPGTEVADLAHDVIEIRGLDDFDLVAVFEPLRRRAVIDGDIILSEQAGDADGGDRVGGNHDVGVDRQGDFAGAVDQADAAHGADSHPG